MHTYEIYVFNPEDIKDGLYAGKKAGTISGWDIKLVKTDKDIKTFPLFDCIITKNDTPESSCELF